jgi:SAM-dependent methyltransferase
MLVRFGIQPLTAPIPLVCPGCRAYVREYRSTLRCENCGRSYQSRPVPRMLSEEFAELLGGHATTISESARWSIDDVTHWEATYADSREQTAERERIRAGRADAGLRTRSRERHIFRHIRPQLRGKVLLDVGCGNAQTVQVVCHPAVVGYSYVGVDLALPPLLVNLQAFPGFFVQASATHLPFPPATFDAILLLGALHHLHRPAEALRGILELLKPGGIVGLHEVTYRRPHTRSRESAHNEHVPLADIVDVLQERCEIIDLKQEHTILLRPLAKLLGERMRTSPRLTSAAMAIDKVGIPLRHLHPALGPRAAVVTARKQTVEGA